MIGKTVLSAAASLTRAVNSPLAGKVLPRLSGGLFFALVLVLGVTLAAPAFAMGKGKPPKDDPPPVGMLPSSDTDLVYSINFSGLGVADSSDPDSATTLIDPINGQSLDYASWLPDGVGVIFCSNLDGWGIYFIETDHQTLFVGEPQQVVPTRPCGLVHPVASPNFQDLDNGIRRYLIAFSDRPESVPEDENIFLADLFLMQVDVSGEAGNLLATLVQGSPVSLDSMIKASDPLIEGTHTPAWHPSGEVITASSCDIPPPEFPGACRNRDVLMIKLLSFDQSGMPDDMEVDRVFAENHLLNLGLGLISRRSWSTDGTMETFSESSGRFEIFILEFASDPLAIGGVSSILSPDGLGLVNLTMNADYSQFAPNFVPGDLDIIYLQKATNSPELCNDPEPKGRFKNAIQNGIAQVEIDIALDQPPVCDQTEIPVSGAVELDLWEGSPLYKQ